jgi:hypothetical protein
MGNAVGNGLMSCGCLIMLLPLLAAMVFGAFALHPLLGVAVVALFVLAVVGAVAS